MRRRLRGPHEAIIAGLLIGAIISAIWFGWFYLVGRLMGG